MFQNMVYVLPTPYVPEKNVIFILLSNILYTYWFSVYVFLPVVSVDPLTKFMDFCVSRISIVSFYFMYFRVLLLGAYTFRIVTYYKWTGSFMNI